MKTIMPGWSGKAPKDETPAKSRRAKTSEAIVDCLAPDNKQSPNWESRSNFQKNVIIGALYWLELGHYNSAKSVLQSALISPDENTLWQPDASAPDLIKQRDALKLALQDLIHARDCDMGPGSVALRYDLARAALALCSEASHD